MAADPCRSLAQSFAAYGAPLPGTVGLAYLPVGGKGVVTLGDWTRGVAWSTSKVPLAIAALRAAREAAEPYVTEAISRSDNAAAERLWSMLGPPAAAAVAVEAVLRGG